MDCDLHSNSVINNECSYDQMNYQEYNIFIQLYSINSGDIGSLKAKSPLANEVSYSVHDEQRDNILFKMPIVP